MGLKVLRALDSATTQIYHFKAIVIAGMGLFTDAYDLFCIAPIMKLLGRIYYPNHSNPHKEQIPPLVVTIMLAVSLLGTACGQVVFGRLGDLIGRRRVYGFALALMIFSSIGSGFSICRTRKCVLSSLGFFRFTLGFGIGGDYPLSATIMSEFANKTTRGAFIAAVFSMQGLGILFGSVVTMTVCAAFQHNHRGNDESTLADADLAWRLILMFGALPASLTFYWRMMMPETARFTALVELNVLQATKDMAKVLDVSITEPEPEPEPKPEPEPEAKTDLHRREEYYPLLSRQFLTRHGRHLFACSAAWFLLDVVFYSSTLFQSKVYSNYLPQSSQLVNPFNEAYHFAKLQAIIAVASTIPGYWASVLLIDRIGRVKIQLLGFLAMAIGLFAIGIPYDMYWIHHKGAWFLFLYGLTFFFSNFGPNTTTFIVPAELFPARFRATCHGISGAAGKIGAMLGSIAFIWASRTKEDETEDNHHARGIMRSLIILAGVSLLGALVTYFFTPETMGRSLEENEIEFGGDEHASIHA